MKLSFSSSCVSDFTRELLLSSSFSLSPEEPYYSADSTVLELEYNGVCFRVSADS